MSKHDQFGPGPQTDDDQKKLVTDQMNLRYNPMRYTFSKFEPRKASTRGLSDPTKVYEGILFHHSYLTYEEFRKKYSDQFVALVTGEKSPEDYTKALILEAIVYIVEISGCLPLPDMALIDRYIKESRVKVPDFNLSSEDLAVAAEYTEANIADRELRSLQQSPGVSAPAEWYKQVPLHLKRLDRFPRFYSITQGSIKKGSKVSVDFPNKNDYTIGVLKSFGSI
jgi:hypothetical protein|tara:strand:- start:8964 stop:9635 length:672 start_codon:yes stop_codon:yes gene_type:complete